MRKNEKDLVVFQQNELNGAIMYKALAKKINSDIDRALLEEMASCEGKHAALLKKLTGRNLKPQGVLKNIVLCGYSVIGKKALFKIMAKGEKAAFKLYEPFFDDFPVTVEIAQDELHHGEMLLSMIDSE